MGTRLLCCFVLMVFALSSRLCAQNDNPTIAVCDGRQYLCASDSLVTLCVSIVVNPNYQHINIISSFEITWGDGSPKTIVPGSKNPPSQTHVYNVKGFHGSCDYEREYVVKLITLHSDPNVPPTNSAFFLYIRNPPRPQVKFSANPACAGKPVELTATPCPTQGVTLQRWDLGDGNTATGNKVTHTYNTPGMKQIGYCIGNNCDTVCVTYLLSVLEPAQADLVADSGVVAGYADPYRVCLESFGSVVRVNAANSTNVSKPYVWTVSPGSGWAWLEPDSLNLNVRRIRFTQEGTYTITVKVNNDCGIESTRSIQIQVIKAPPLLLNPAPDTCVAIAYSPVPFNSNAVYRINGVVQSTFPVNLPISNDPYVVEATLSNECGDQLKRDTFWIRPPADISIYTPSDITVCAGSDSIRLRASDVGVWSGGGSALQVVGQDTFFYPSTAGNYLLVISRGVGVCRRADTVQIRVEEGYPLQLNAPPTGCLTTAYTPEPFDPKVQYYIGGVLQTSFPINLSAQGSPYTITAVAQNTCGEVRDSVVLDIIVPVEVSIEAPNDTVVCSGTAPIPLKANDNVGKWIGQYIEQTPQGEWVFNPVQAGTYLLVFERGFDLCRRADSVQVRVEPSNGVTAGPDQYACITQGTLTLTGFGPAGGVFSGFALNGNMVDLSQLTPDSPYTYVYTVPALPDACNDDEMTLVVSAPPTAAFSVSHDTTCVGYTVTLTPHAGGNVQFEVNWGDVPATSDLSHTYQAPGTYAIELTAYTVNPISGGVLCSTQATTSVHILRPMAADSIRFLVKPDSGCAPLTVVFENRSAAESATYEWDFGNGQTHSGFQPGPITFQQGIEDTIYYVRLTVRNACDSLVRVEPVRVRPQPRAALGITYEQPCSGGVLKASVLSTGNPLNNTFFTSKGQMVSASRDKPSEFLFFTDSLPDTVRLWLVSTNQCGTDTAYQDVVVHPTDVYALMGLPDTTRLCVGDSVRLSNISTPGAPVRWAISNGNTFLGDTAWVVFSQPGLYDVTLYAYGCGYDSVVQRFRVHPLPTLAVVHEPARCPGDTVTFSAQTNAPGFWLAFGDGDSTTLKTAKRAYFTPGVYPVTAMAISDRGCRTTWSSTLNVLTPPTATAVGDDSLCVGAPAVFSGSSTIPGSVCTWRFGDGNTANGCQATHTYKAPGLFAAALTVISPEGCRGTDTVLVYVRTRPEAQFTYTIQRPCSPAVVAFQSQTTGATGLTWHLGDGATQTDNAFQHTYAQGGRYTVRLIASNEGICYDTAEQAVVVFQTPNIAFTLDPQCTLAEGTHLTVLAPETNYVLVSGPDKYEKNGSFHPKLPSGYYTISITTPENCRRDTLIFLLPPNELQLWLDEDSFDIRLGERVQLQARVNQTGVTFQWSPSARLDRSDVPNPVATPWQTAVYVVTATNLAGCPKTDTAHIRVRIDRDEGLFIPNAFTPNGDGINDIFYVRNSNPAIEGFNRFQIFDKYDEKVFDALELPDGHEAAPENPLWGWDGTFRGGKAEMGAYRYVLELRYVDGVVRALVGTIHLLR